MTEHRIAPGDIVDMHAHIYPDGCFDEVLKARPEFALVRSQRGLSLTCRGSHTMSAPADADLSDRLRVMDEAGVKVEVLSVGALNIGWAGDAGVAAAPAGQRRSGRGLPGASGPFPLCRRAALDRHCRAGGRGWDRAMGPGRRGRRYHHNHRLPHARRPGNSGSSGARPTAGACWCWCTPRSRSTARPMTGASTCPSATWARTAMAAAKLALGGRARRVPRRPHRLVPLRRRPVHGAGPHRPRLPPLREVPAPPERVPAPMLVRHRHRVRPRPRLRPAPPSAPTASSTAPTSPTCPMAARP